MPASFARGTERDLGFVILVFLSLEQWRVLERSYSWQLSGTRAEEAAFLLRGQLAMSLINYLLTCLQYCPAPWGNSSLRDS